jgi:hypothetical protein
VSEETARLLASRIDRPGINFYALRHASETMGGEGRDQVAMDAIMDTAASPEPTVTASATSGSCP